jgi:hypothetical protein
LKKLESDLKQRDQDFLAFELKEEEIIKNNQEMDNNFMIKEKKYLEVIAELSDKVTHF